MFPYLFLWERGGKKSLKPYFESVKKNIYSSSSLKKKSKSIRKPCPQTPTLKILHRCYILIYIRSLPHKGNYIFSSAVKRQEKILEGE